MTSSRKKELEPSLSERVDALHAVMESSGIELISFRARIFELNADFSKSLVTLFEKISVISVGAIVLSFPFITSSIQINKAVVKDHLAYATWGMGLLLISTVLAPILIFYISAGNSDARANLFGLELDYLLLQKSLESPDQKKKSYEDIGNRLKKLTFKYPMAHILFSLITFGIGFALLLTFFQKVLSAI